MGDMLITFDSLTNLELITRKSLSLFQSGDLKPRKRIAKAFQSELSIIPQCDLGSDTQEIDLGSPAKRDCRGLNLVLDIENDRQRVGRYM